jgi:hypothetical protein
LGAVKAITGIIAIVLGIAFLAITVICLTFVPDSLSGFDVEPEDLLILVAICVYAAFVGTTSLLSGVILLRLQSSVAIPAKMALWLLIASTLIAGTLVAICAKSADSADNVLIGPLLAAAILHVWSSYLIHRSS